jgi:O-antigen ligase
MPNAERIFAGPYVIVKSNRVALGDGLLTLILLAALLLPLGVPSGDSPVKGALQLTFAVVVSTVLLAVLAAYARVPGLAGRLALWMLPYALVLGARGGYIQLGYLVAIVAVILVSACGQYGNGFWRITVLAIGILSCAYLALWLSEGGQLQFRAWTVNKNYLGTQLLFMSVVTACAIRFLRDPLERLLCVAVLTMLMLLLVVTSSRASLLAAGFFFLAYFMWPFLSRRRSRLTALFVTTLTLSILIVPTYVALWASPLGADLDNLSMSMTGQRFFSGRQFVWPVYMLVIMDAPLFGHGFVFDQIIHPALWEGLPEHYEKLSAHNLYLMIAIQTGMIGLLAFCIFVIGIWRLLTRNPRHAATRIAAPAFLAFLLHEVFEVTLVQNNLILAWPMWVLIGFALREAQPHRVQQS